MDEIDHELIPPPKRQKVEEDVQAIQESSSSVSSVANTHEGDSEANRLRKEYSDPLAQRLLMEKDVGITEYICPKLPGFFAILKQRYSDFHVHELSLDGSTARLTSFTLPQDPKKVTTKLDSVFSTDDVERLRVLSQNGNSDEEIKIKVTDGKEERTVMHRAIREHFPQLESKTEDGDDPDGKVINIQFVGKKTNQRGGRSQWPPERGSYCKFVLYKENKDTMDAVNLIAHLLKVKPSTLHYAGTKDHRAVTSQQATAFRVTADRLLSLNKTSRNFKLGNFEYVRDPLKLGDLKGNKFTVILRKLSCDDHVIHKSLESLVDLGFINYFGMQRFGTSTVPTHQIGRCLLKSDWQGAIDLILKPRPNEPESVSSARKYYLESKDAPGAAAMMPKWRSIEKNLLQGLEKHADKCNLLGALNFIPRNTRLMYVHSWQSLLWNKMLSWRIRELGRAPVMGDIVRKKSPRLPEHEDKRDSQTAGDGNEVEFVTEENICLYSIEDVLLPLPGWDVKLPQNQCGEEYLRLLGEEGFTLEQLKHRVKDFSLSGSYRSVIVKPADITWSIFRYDDVTVAQVVSDLEAMEGKDPPKSLSEGKFKGLKLEFSLPPSCYATMVIRELTHMDTSSAYQSTLNPTSSSC